MNTAVDAFEQYDQNRRRHALMESRFAAARYDGMRIRNWLGQGPTAAIGHMPFPRNGR
jgi:hypothetical protein